MRIFLIVFLSIFISGCFYTSAREAENICQLLDDNIIWYRAVKESENKYQAPMHLQLAIIHQESRFASNAKPARKYYFNIIPGPRLSSSYGYSQANKATWDWYKLKSGNTNAVRSNFSDSVDFIAWYIHKSYVLSGIPKTDSYRQYLAYHEGHNGYDTKTYKNKQWLVNVAKKVENQANKYKKQLSKCRKHLDKRKVWIIF